MSEVQEMREQIIAVINRLPDERLKEVDALLKKITSANDRSIENIYAEAVKRYGETLQKLAQ